MKQVIVYTTDEDYEHFIELTRHLSYVKRIETGEDSKEIILENIKDGLKEVGLFKKGKLKTTFAKDFLNEL